LYEKPLEAHQAKADLSTVAHKRYQVGEGGWYDWGFRRVRITWQVMHRR